MCKILGYDKEELIGMNYKNISDEITNKRLFNAFHQVYETDKHFTDLTFPIIKKDGEKVILETSIYLKNDPYGNKIGFSGIVRFKEI